MNRAILLAMLCALCIFPAICQADVFVVDLSSSPQARCFADGLKSYFSSEKGELGGADQNYALHIFGKEDTIKIVLNGETEPRWVISRQEISSCPAVVFKPTASVQAIADRIYNDLCRLEKERLKAEEKNQQLSAKEAGFFIHH
jgi:hypothetical protein